MIKKTDAEPGTIEATEAEISADNPKTLYDPKGIAFEASTPEEVVNLMARGYTESKGK